MAVLTTIVSINLFSEILDLGSGPLKSLRHGFGARFTLHLVRDKVLELGSRCT